MQTEPIIVEVTQKHIDAAVREAVHGSYKPSYQCVIAQALRDTFLAANISVGHASAMVDGVQFSLGPYGKVAAVTMLRSDRLNEVKPFTMTLHRTGA